MYMFYEILLLLRTYSKTYVYIYYCIYERQF